MKRIINTDCRVIILVGGTGTKMWPFNGIRNKCMMPVVNIPLIRHTVNQLLKNGRTDITVAGSSHMDDLRSEFSGTDVKVVETSGLGNADTLLQCLDDRDYVFLFGDCLIAEADLVRLLDAGTGTVLLGRIQDNPHSHIVAQVQADRVSGFLAHPRGTAAGCFLAGGRFSRTLTPYLERCPGYFENTKVGVGAPHEHVIENALNHYLRKNPLTALIAGEPVFDADKPWDVLDANRWYAERMCAGIRKDVLGENSKIEAGAEICGHVRMGRNSFIGRGVLVEGNIVVGDNTVIRHGACIGGSAVIGSNCIIQNSCKIGGGSVIGDDCIIEQTAELLSGVLMKKNYLYHHCEFYGLMGERCDLGAGTVCGTLRFDDGETVQKVHGCKEVPLQYANAAYVGDFTRCGVGAILFPGVKIGTSCVIGPGTIVEKEIADNRLVYVKQELVEKEWGCEKYGW
jgi:NDP-sugar pyrophosphorylase family protein